MAIYTPALKPTTHDRLVMMKTTVASPVDGDWASVDGEVVLGGAVVSMWAVEDSSDIKIATQLENGRVDYHVFDPGTTAWTIENEKVVEVGDTDFDVTPANKAVSLAIRSDGDVVVVAAYNDGTNEALRVFARESSSWTNKGKGNDGGDASGVAVVGPDSSDRISWSFIQDTAVKQSEKTPDNANQDVKGATGTEEKQAQSFQYPADTTITGVILKLAHTADPVDDVIIGIQADASGEPSGTFLASEQRAGNAITSSSQENTFTWSGIVLTGSTKYWIVMERTGSRDVTNYTRWAIDTTPTYSDGASFQQDNGTWSEDTGEDKDFETIQDANLALFLNSISSVNTIDGDTLIDTTIDTATLLVAPGVIDSANKIYIPYIDADNQISVASWTSGASPSPVVDASVGLATAAFNGATSAPFVAACLGLDGTDVHLLYSDSTFDLQHNDDVDGGGAGSETEEVTGTVNRISCAKGTSDLLYVYDDAGTTKFGIITLGGGVDTPMVAGAGSFTLGGVAANTEWGHKTIGAAGAFVLSGKAAVTSRDVPIVGGAGAFTLGGVAANLLWKHVLVGGAGSFTLGGVAANLLWKHLVAGAAGSFLLTGVAVTTSRNVSILGAAGSFTLGGKAANLLWGHLLPAALGTFVLSGKAAITAKTVNLSGAAGSFTISGKDANTLWKHIITAALGTFTLTGLAAGTRVGQTLQGAAGTYALSGVDAITLWKRLLVATAGTYTLTGLDAALLRALLVLTNPGSYILTGLPAITSTEEQLLAEAGAYVLTGVEATTSKAAPPTGNLEFDKFSNPVAGTGTLSWTHTPVGTARGVIVHVVENDTTSDGVTGITYGGEAMTEVPGSPNIQSGSEPSATHCYFLGSGIPTGAQTVVVSISGVVERQAGAITVTAGGDTEVIDSDGTISGTNETNPSVILSLAGRTCFASIGFQSGQSFASSITPFTNWTDRLEEDFTGQFGGWYTYDIIGSTDISAGWTQAANRACAVTIAISEIPSVVVGGLLPLGRRRRR